MSAPGSITDLSRDADADRQDDPVAWLSSNGGAPMHDPLALMSVFKPDVLQHVGKYHVDVETGSAILKCGNFLLPVWIAARVSLMIDQKEQDVLRMKLNIEEEEEE